jgi:uncharacterized iron-regulated membrane protein
MEDIWQYFLSHWLGLSFAPLLAVLVVIGITKLIDEIRFRIARRRYRLAKK